jgi:hypothetical protein
LGLVRREGSAFVPNPAAPIAKEVLDYLVHEHSYGNRDTRSGRALEAHFGGIGYGWERDMLRLVLAVLLRAGSIEVSYNGQRFDVYQDPQCRVPFTNNTAFRSAIFTPVEPIALKLLTNAVEAYEALTGKTVDVEKGAIAAALKEWARGERETLLPLRAKAEADRLPVIDELADYGTRLQAILDGAADDCVRALAGEGASLREARDRVHRLASALDGGGLRTLREARSALESMWPELRRAGEDGELESHAQTLQDSLSSPGFYERMADIARASHAIGQAYRKAYEQAHTRRAAAYVQAIEGVRGEVDWVALNEAEQASVLRELQARSCLDLDLHADGTRCVRCGAALAQLESDYLAVPALRADALAQMHELAATKGPGVTTIQRVRLADYLGGSIASPDELDAALQRLSDDLHKYLDAGATLVFE